VKRTIDVLLVLLTAGIWLPAVGIVAVLVAVFEGFPVFFWQDRAGKDGKAFRFLKFRTMRGGAGTDAERLTRLGRVLRATSLDELPQLFLVLSGKMALVGPRPLPVAYLPRYSDEQSRRHEVRPGLTGWAQVNGRNLLSWEEKFKLDVWYVDHQTLALDAKILLLTFVRVFSRNGINSPGAATMQEFKGLI
jgi:sugar transferase EpsL